MAGTYRTLRPGRLTTFVLIGYVVALLASLPAVTQSKKPISKNGLLEAVRLNGFSTEELIGEVKQRGVSFQLTPGDESEFLSSGARPELMEAVRSNYRPAGASATGPPAGPALSKAEIVTMLQVGTPPARVEQFVKARSVNFTLTEQIRREIRAVGGNASLLGAISEKASGGRGASSGPSRPSPGASAVPDYDDLTDQAQTALSGMNPVLAGTLLQQAIKLDPSKSKAYQLFGSIQLYHNLDIASAEKSMRAAIERGGSAVFKVLHDHGTGAFTSRCEGSFFVSKSSVKFNADTERDTFEAADTLIKEAKLNKKFFGIVPGARLNAFHITVSKLRNFNFAPRTGSEAEAIMIIKLIESYQ
jgi:hypothetical protein